MHRSCPFSRTNTHKRRPQKPSTQNTPKPLLLLSSTQLFELLLTLAGSQRFRPLLAPALPELAALCVTYSQMGAAQQEAWLEDANALIADEESDVVGCRREEGLLSSPSLADVSACLRPARTPAHTHA